MLKYIIRRILFIIPALFGISLTVFVIMTVIPGDPGTLILGDKERDESLVSYRRHGSLKTYSVQKDTFKDLLLNEIRSKKSNKNQENN